MGEVAGSSRMERVLRELEESGYSTINSDRVTGNLGYVGSLLSTMPYVDTHNNLVVFDGGVAVHNSFDKDHQGRFDRVILGSTGNRSLELRTLKDKHEQVSIIEVPDLRLYETVNRRFINSQQVGVTIKTASYQQQTDPRLVLDVSERTPIYVVLPPLSADFKRLFGDPAIARTVLAGVERAQSGVEHSAEDAYELAAGFLSGTSGIKH